MKFMFLLHGDLAAEAALPREERMRIVAEHMEWAAKLRERGAYVSGEALESPSTAVVVRPGEPVAVTDGPFAETKEAVGGFYVVDVADRDEAIRLAGEVPLSPGLAVEVLTVAEL